MMNKIYASAIVLFMVLGITHFGSAFTGPTNSGGVGSGAVAVDGFNNIGVGASSTYSVTRLYVRASSTATTSYALRVLQPDTTPLFTIRDDGAVAIATTTPSGVVTTKLSVGGDTSITGTLTATAIVGALSGTVNASNVSAGVFGAGNFAFPSSLGIATTTQVGLPAALSVYGTGYISGLLSVGATTTATVAIFGGGTGKIDVGTIDPPYTINGKSYATYLPSMTGVKEETAGTLRCEAVRGSTTCTAILDFANAIEGSDIWLFSKTTNLKHSFNEMSVLATPGFNGRVWYEKDASGLRLIVKAVLPAGMHSGEISYRLTAPRFDAASWPNAPTNPTSPGFIIED